MASLPRARTWTFVAFALPAFQTALVHGPVGVIVPSIYSTEWGLNLAAVGTILLVSRIFDAVTDHSPSPDEPTLTRRLMDLIAARYEQLLKA